MANISIHALREEGDAVTADGVESGMISIHALREEGDLVAAVGFQCHIISIHALREEGDGDCRMRYQIVYIFLSTPSARRATSGKI